MVSRRHKLEVTEKGSGHHFQLGEGHILSKASPRAGVEGEELVRGLSLNLPIVGDPSLRLKLAAVLTPNGHRHRVREEEDLSLRADLVAAGKDIRFQSGLVVHGDGREKSQALVQSCFQVNFRAEILNEEDARVDSWRLGKTTFY